LFVASPDLEERLPLWQCAPDSAAGQKIERALVRYFARMAGRATPFGLFAGCSVGSLGSSTELELVGRAEYRRHTYLNPDYLILLADALARTPALRRALRFTVNPSLYRTPRGFCNCELRQNGDGWTHHRVCFEAADYLEATLARAREGATPQALARVLLDRTPDASEHEADEYINELIDMQVLVSELRPPLTGPEPLPGLSARLREETLAADRLEQARQELDALDAGGLGGEPARYRRIACQLDDLPAAGDRGRLFQVDLIKPTATARLGPDVLDEIGRGVALLHRLACRPHEDALARFQAAFVERYGGREVPLVEALDEEIGIGFSPQPGAVDSALLDGLSLPPRSAPPALWRRREAVLLGKLSAALAAGADEVRLSPRDVEALAEPNPPPLPDAFAVRAALAAPSAAALARGDFRLRLDGLSGPSGARLLGRFCHACPPLQQEVERHLRAEEALQPDTVFAEIVHLPEGRPGNLLARPILRAYEIPLGGSAAVPAERQIPVTDLSVAVEDGQIVLRSARLGRRVLPRLTSAHNFPPCPGIYGFLGALQAQGTTGALGWDWGPLRDAPFLPRVVAGRLVLARACWRVGTEELQALSALSGARRFRGVQHWRAERRLPRWVVLADGDRELPVDLDNVLAVETLVELIKGQDEATLVELFPAPEALCARGPEGRFVHEVLVPFVRSTRPAAEPLRRRSLPDVQRSFAPGSEWLYVKLYTGRASADQVLREFVAPVIEAVRRSGAADRWFFIRYGDPDWHLRLRWHGEPARLHDAVLPLVQAATAPLMADGRLWRVQLDTYEREVERYGGAEGIVLAESLFEADSEAVLALVAASPADPRGDLRWRLALMGMHQLLMDLGFDRETRRSIARQARDRFATACAADADLRHQLGARFRKERHNLEGLLRSDVSEWLAQGLAILQRRSQCIAPISAELRTCAERGRLTLPLVDLAPSYLHMHANRLLCSAHPAQELVLYDFLARLYETRAEPAGCERRQR
jgi:thiopeptide-type bacteriocin biosynthesis protein